MRLSGRVVVALVAGVAVLLAAGAWRVAHHRAVLATWTWPSESEAAGGGAGAGRGGAVASGTEYPVGEGQPPGGARGGRSEAGPPADGRANDLSESSSAGAVVAYGAYGGWSEAAGNVARGALVVDVEGAVRRPGLYLFPPGARVWDALQAAGGKAAGADTKGINLAGELADGQRVYVPKQGEHPPANAGARTGTGGGGASGGEASAAAGPVDINRAGVEALDGLPGIGSALAQRIVRDRQAHGPFKSLADLARVAGIGPVTVARLKGLAVAR